MRYKDLNIPANISFIVPAIAVLAVIVSIVSVYVTARIAYQREIEFRLSEADQILQAVKVSVSTNYDLLANAADEAASIFDGRTLSEIPTRELILTKSRVEKLLSAFDIQVQFWTSTGSAPLAPDPATTISDRDFFHVLVGAPAQTNSMMIGDTGLAVGAPVLGRIRPKWIMPTAKAVRGASGDVLGIVTATIPIDKILASLSALRNAPGDTLFIMRNDHVGLIRYPVDDRFMGRSLPQALVFQNYPDQPIGTFRGDAATDGIARIGRHLSLAPLPIVAGFSFEPEPFQLRRLYDHLPIATVAGIQVLLIALFGFVATRAVRSATSSMADATARDAEMRAILAVANDAIVCLDANRRIRLFNSSAEKMFGVKSEAILGMPLDQLLPIEARHRHEKLMQDMAVGAASGRSMSNWRTVRGMRADGNSFPASVSISKVMHGTTLEYIGIVRDMTEIVRHEVELTDAMRLEATLRIKSDEANQAKSLFIASMGHELRTPLNAIIGYSEAIALGVGGVLSNSTHRMYIDNILSAGHHLISVINDIIDVSRLQSDSHEFEHVSVEINQIITEAYSIVAHRFNQRSINLVRIHDADKLNVVSDPRAIRQILINVLINAAKFGPAGGKVTIRTQAMDKRATISVQDEGPGIPEKIMARIGNPFIQDRSLMISNNEGIGLGLAISVRLAEGLGGRLTFRNVDEGGLEARLTLPTDQV